MTRAEQIAADADARVGRWVTLSPGERQALVDELPAHIEDLRAGGAMLSVNGVDRWCPSRRHAEAELDALTDRWT